MRKLFAVLAALVVWAAPASGQYTSSAGTIGRMTIFPSYVRATSFDTSHPVANCPSNGFILLATSPNYDAFLAAMIAAQHARRELEFVVDDACHNGDGAIILAIHVYTD